MKNAQPHGDRDRYEQALAKLDRRAYLLDSQFRVPFTSIRFGLDPLVGLLPGVGDVIGMVLSLQLIIEAVRIGAGRVTVMRMLGNVLVETVIGIVPIAGDAFDVYWKANTRNVALLRRFLHKKLEPERPRRKWVSYSLLLVLGGLILVLMFLVVYSLWGQS